MFEEPSLVQCAHVTSFFSLTTSRLLERSKEKKELLEIPEVSAFSHRRRGRLPHHVVDRAAQSIGAASHPCPPGRHVTASVETRKCGDRKGPKRIANLHGNVRAQKPPAFRDATPCLNPFQVFSHYCWLLFFSEPDGVPKTSSRSLSPQRFPAGPRRQEGAKPQ